MSGNYATFPVKRQADSLPNATVASSQSSSRSVLHGENVAVAEPMNEGHEVDLEDATLLGGSTSQRNKGDEGGGWLSKLCWKCFPRRLSRLGKFVVMIAIITLIGVLLMLIFG